MFTPARIFGKPKPTGRVKIKTRTEFSGRLIRVSCFNDCFVCLLRTQNPYNTSTKTYHTMGNYGAHQGAAQVVLRENANFVIWGIF